MLTCETVYFMQSPNASHFTNNHWNPDIKFSVMQNRTSLLEITMHHNRHIEDVGSHLRTSP